MKKVLVYKKYLLKVKNYFIFSVISGILYGVMGGIGVPVIFEKVFRGVFEEHSTSNMELLAYVLILPSIFLIRGILGFINSYFMIYSGLDFVKSLRSDIFTKMQYLSLKFYDENSHGDLIARATIEPTIVQNFILNFASEAIKQPAQIISAICGIAILSWKSQNYVLVPLVSMSIGISILPGRKLKKVIYSLSSLVQESMGKFNQLIAESLDAVPEIRAFSMETQQISRHNQELAGNSKIILQLTKYERLVHPVSEVSAVFAIGILFVFCYLNSIPFSTFSAMGFALLLTVDPVKKTISMYADYNKVKPSLERISYMLEMESDVKEPTIPKTLSNVKGKIEFQNVKFSYGESPTLKNISVIINPGEHIALVGSSGAGKSTFFKLINRFYDIEAGNILLDGTDTKTMLSEHVREHIAVVPQYPVLFNSSIYDNIAAGNLNATASEIYDAARIAFAHDFIEGLPDKYETVVGNRGDLLSGGQKKRIAIARAILKNAPILIFDEATSALDAESEFHIKTALEVASKGKTVISIAHRLSTIANADRIFVFDSGEIIDSGTHNELLQRSEKYKNFVKYQLVEVDST